MQVLIPLIILAAILDDNVGYSIGRRSGHRIFKREDSILFHKDNLIRAEKFYEKHSGKKVTIARFVPMIRTFAPMVAVIVLSVGGATFHILRDKKHANL